MSKGYIQSSEKIRDRLLVGEWELSRKAVAMRRQAGSRGGPRVGQHAQLAGRGQGKEWQHYSMAMLPATLRPRQPLHSRCTAIMMQACLMP